MVESYADLEIALRWVEAQHAFDVGLRFVQSDQNVDDWNHVEDLLPLNLDELAMRVNSVDSYADYLTKSVFREDVKSFYQSSRARAQGRQIHVRLTLNAAPPALHRVRWELLRDPTEGNPVATTDDVLFSRYLTSADFRAVPWRTRHASRALVVISSPSDIDRYMPNGRRLAHVDVDKERGYAEQALAGIETVYLAGPGEATLANIARELSGDVDILYLVCHGALLTDVPMVFLEHADGTAHDVDGRRLQELVTSLPQRPTLALLNSCQSAGPGGVETTTDEGVLAGLGPRLAAAGVATVIAMQGNVAVDTARRFAERFFVELQDDGVIDRSVAAARRVLREEGRNDWWVPVLFSRLRTGRSYFKAQFTGDGDRLWEQLSTSQATGYLTPVLGPGMSDEIIGPRQAIAERWATRWQMPIAVHNREDLSKVAQYLQVQQRAPGAIGMRVAEYLKQEIEQRVHNAKDLPDDPFHGVDGSEDPQDAILAAGARLLERDEGYAYRVVAGMPVPIYITTNWTPLLQQALAACTPPRTPVTAHFEWNDRANWAKRPPRSLKPTVEHPLVYHLFGSMDDPDSLVLTEDDYFEWLVAWVARRTTVPDAVQKRLTSRPLMFLGYNLDDWDFKVVFQSIKSYPASGQLLRRNAHVGVQLTPGSRDVEPEAAQEYLESYLDSDNVGIYWSDTRKFLDEFRQRTGSRNG